MAPQKKQGQAATTGFQAFRFQEAKPNHGAPGLQKPAGVSKQQLQQHQQKHLASAPFAFAAKEDVENPVEQLLRQFDLNSAFGPCIGMTRLARWDRAHRFGKKPPAEIRDALKSNPGLNHCLWHNRV
ncbi:DNA polymerase delta, subunit 4-domain-containing protein [Dunaliella salina]|uniref:DNA polymerase delta, subunit 4-domain-containing protein n=1 Tax=Dunaliella salina TaxID=3046 RepID=A0ABQ7GZK8_DUNSA|nr:DNA polymerase delta, subunit 4-domain-containing protein [Dunaliella salina]|eukprot:KAF5840055.1 DNA polymerase delta, subunit 4-domain-containing protein [Dunaliella salina]